MGECEYKFEAFVLEFGLRTTCIRECGSRRKERRWRGEGGEDLAVLARAGSEGKLKQGPSCEFSEFGG